MSLTAFVAMAAIAPYVSGFMGGVNTAGYDFSVNTTGFFQGPYTTPPTDQFTHFANEGVNIFRIPFAWQLMQPDGPGTSIDESFFSTYDATVQSALSSGEDMHVIVDVHNYARLNGEIIGQGGPSNDQFADFWSQVASKYADDSRIIFGVMNEPHDLDVDEWAVSVQAAVTAIRGAGATSQLIIMPGSSYASAQMLPTEAGPALLEVIDPIGNNTLLLFDVHKYLDSDNSGTHPDCVTDNVAVFQTLLTFLQQNGRQALLSETGGGNTESCETDLKSELAFIKENDDYFVGFAAWAAGGFDTSYTLSLTPFSNGTDQALFTDAILPNLP